MKSDLNDFLSFGNHRYLPLIFEYEKLNQSKDKLGTEKL